MLDNLPFLSYSLARLQGRNYWMGSEKEYDISHSILLIRDRVRTGPTTYLTYTCDQRSLAVGVTFGFYRLWLSCWFMLLHISPDATNFSRWSIAVVHVKPFLLLILVVSRQMVSFYHYPLMFWPGHLLIKVNDLCHSKWMNNQILCKIMSCPSNFLSGGKMCVIRWNSRNLLQGSI